MIVRTTTLAVTVAAGLTAGCGATSGKADHMDHASLELVTRVPWGGELPRALVARPQVGDTFRVETWQSPAAPLIRLAADGAVGVLAYQDGHFAAATDVTWATVRDGRTTWHRAPDPFVADRAALTGVDFAIDADQRLVVLETVAGIRAQLIVATADGAARGLPLEGPEGSRYARLVPDEGGRLYLVRQGSASELVPLDPSTGALGAPIAITPGSRLAVAANRGAAIPTALLKADPGGKVTAPTALPQALIYMFGVDDRGDYYTRFDDVIVRVGFAGEVRSRLPLTALPELRPAATGAIRGQLAPLPEWQVDRAGRIYVPRTTLEAFELVRITPQR